MVSPWPSMVMLLLTAGRASSLPGRRLPGTARLGWRDRRTIATSVIVNAPGTGGTVRLRIRIVHIMRLAATAGEIDCPLSGRDTARFEGHPEGTASLLACGDRHRVLPVQAFVEAVGRDLFGDPCRPLGFVWTFPGGGIDYLRPSRREGFPWDTTPCRRQPRLRAVEVGGHLRRYGPRQPHPPRLRRQFLRIL
jgi:hypothetical protein